MFDKRLLREALKLKHYILLMILLGIGTGLLAVSQAYALSFSIGQVFLDHGTLARVGGALITLLCILAVRSAFVWVLDYYARKGAGILKLDLERGMLEGIRRKGPIALKEEKAGEILGVFSEGLQDLETYYSEYVPQIALALFTPLVILSYAFATDWISALIMVGTAILIPLFMVLIGKWGQTLTQERWEKLSIMSAHFLEVLRGLETLKLFGRSKSQERVISRISEDFRKTTMEVLRVSFLSALVLELATTISTAMVAVSLGLRLLYGGIGFQESFFLILLAPEFYLPLRMLGLKFHAGMGGKAAADRIYAIIGEEEAVNGKEEAVNGKTAQTDGTAAEDPGNNAGAVTGKTTPTMDGVYGRGGTDISVGSPREGIALTFDGVTFTYPGETRKALQEFSFRLEPGSRTVLAGPSGGGKSTVMSLLLGFIKPTSGRILVNGTEFSHMDMSSWRRLVAYIPQNPTLFYGNIFENILLARQGASKEEVLAAARASGADEFIGQLPNGYDTFIGEGGITLSAGQRQLVALTRAFLKDAPLVILDEVTSAMDARSESMVKASIQKLGRGRTLLLISHRASMLEEDDRILILKEGKLAGECRRNSLKTVLEELENSGGMWTRNSETSEVKQEQQLWAEGSWNRQSEVQTGLAEHGEEGEKSCVSDREGTRYSAGVKVEEADASSPTDSASSTDTASSIDAAKTTDGKSSQGTEGIASTLKILKKFLVLFMGYKWSMALALLAGVLTILSNISLLGLSSYIISTAALQVTLAELMLPIVGVRFFGISRGVFRYLERVLSHNTTFRILGRVRVWFYRRVEPLDTGALVRKHSGDLLSRMVGDVEALREFYLRVFNPPLVAILVLVAMTVFLYRYDAGIAMIYAVLYIIAGLAVPALGGIAARKSGMGLPGRKAELQGHLADYLSGLTELEVFGALESKNTHILKLGESVIAMERHNTSLNGLTGSLVTFLGNLAMLLTVVFCIPLVSSGNLPGNHMAMLAIAVLSSFEAVQPLASFFPRFYESLAAMKRLVELGVDDAGSSSPGYKASAQKDDAHPIIDSNGSSVIDPNGASATDPKGTSVHSSCIAPITAGGDAPTHKGGTPAASGEPVVELRGVGMNYGEERNWALTDINLRIAKGSRIALVGPTGAGKSSILRLLLGFCRPSAGEVVLANPIEASETSEFLSKTKIAEHYTEADPSSRRAFFSVVPQNPYIFHGTIRENLLLADPDADDEMMMHAAKTACLHELILTLPEGYDTVIGERGHKLSGGELQRLAVARAVLKDAPVMLLDEPTSNLDAATEKRLMESILNHAGDKSILLITHRLVAMERMDEILVLEEGSITQRGTHRELLCAGGLYAHLYRLQQEK